MYLGENADMRKCNDQKKKKKSWKKAERDFRALTLLRPTNLGLASSANTLGQVILIIITISFICKSLNIATGKS